MPPSAAQTFQQIAGPQEGPFSEYLRPRPIDTMRPPGQWATGYESPGVGAGQVALDFLKSVRQNRLAEAQEQDQNVESQLNNFRAQVNAKLQDPDLTDEGRQAILDEANTILNQHMQYELRDVKDKGGVRGFLKDMLINAAGGPIKTRQPINWDEATGRIHNVAQGHSQKEVFRQAVVEAQSAIDALRRDNPNITAEQVQQAVMPTLYKLMQGAPSYADPFLKTISMGYPAAGSWQWTAQELTRTKRAVPQTGAPPTAPPPTPTTAAAQPTIAVRPADTAQPAAAAPAAAIEYEPGYDAHRFALLSQGAGTQNSPVQISQATPVTVHTPGGGSARTQAVMVIGGPEGDNGYWDANTWQKIKSPVTRESVESSQLYPQGGTNVLHRLDAATGQMVPVLDDKGKPFVRSFASESYYDPNTGAFAMGPRGAGTGKVPMAAGLQAQRSAEEIDKLRAAAFTEADQRRSAREMDINRQAYSTRNGILSRQIETVTQGMAALGMAADKASIEAAMANPQALLDEIEQQRQRLLQDAQRFWQNEAASIRQNYPEVQRVAAPRPAAKPAAAAPKQASPKAAATPVSGVEFDSLIKD